MDIASLLVEIRKLAQGIPELSAALDSIGKPAKREKRVKVQGNLRPRNVGEFVRYIRPDGIAPIEHIAPLSKAAQAYRDRIDAQGEREAQAIETLETEVNAGRDMVRLAIVDGFMPSVGRSDWRQAQHLVGRFHSTGKGDALANMDYVRELARSEKLYSKQLATDDVGKTDATESKEKRGSMRLIQRKGKYDATAYRKMWRKVCRYHQREIDRMADTSLAPLPKPANRLPGWARKTQENDAARARRKLQQQYRTLVRAIGAAKIANIPGAAELYAKLTAAGSLVAA